MDVTLLREIGVALAGVVMGLCAVVIAKYHRVVEESTETTVKDQYKLVIWMVATIGVFAVFQGFTRALLITTHAPGDYRDWVAIVLQLNSLLLLGTVIRRESRWGNK